MTKGSPTTPAISKEVEKRRLQDGADSIKEVAQQINLEQIWQLLQSRELPPRAQAGALEESHTTSGPGLEVRRVVIPAFGGIPAHTHPGPQLAVIVEGTLSYSVLGGEVEVRRCSRTDAAENETISSGETARLSSGDSLVEPTGVAHEARNGGEEPVVMHVASLFPADVPPMSRHSLETNGKGQL